MSNGKTAFITGISGQDGSYLAEYLYSLGYKVHGIVRRNSVPEHQSTRISSLVKEGKIFITYGDLLDPSSLENVLTRIQPDEIYNLGAQSHVRISSEIPQFTVQTNSVGALNMLEAYRKCCPDARYYQASSSEMFGNSIEKGGVQSETTPMHPVSPYGCSKLFAYHITRHYRNAYKLHACNGILFNHETLASFMPVIFREGSEIDIKPIGEVVQHHTGNDVVNEKYKSYQEGEVLSDLYIWDNSDWTRVTFASGYPNSIKNETPRMIVTKNSCYMTTQDHVIIMDDDTEVKCKDVSVGNKVKLVELPKNFTSINLSLQEAELLGMIVGDGHVSKDKQRFVISNKDQKFINRATDLWAVIGKLYGKPAYNGTYTGDRDVVQLRFNGFSEWITQFQCYTEKRKKRVPKQILNATRDVQKAFLTGYNSADGLKKNPCVYTFKNFKTNSATLAQGLVFLLNATTEQMYNINVELGSNYNTEGVYYSINVLSDSRFSLSKSEEKRDIVVKMLEEGVSQREICRETKISRNFIRKVIDGYIPTGQHHLSIPFNEVKKIIEFDNYDGWFYDLTTQSGKFHCGIGQGRIHNSPRRAANFVTNKIVKGAVRIRLGMQDKLELGNLDTFRDWGHSKDYVRAMHLIVNHDTPDDFVVATGKTHSIRYLCKYVFNKLGLNYEDHVVQNPKYMRPEELQYLKGDSSRIRKELGWKPEYTFETLLDEMIEAAEEIYSKQLPK